MPRKKVEKPEEKSGKTPIKKVETKPTKTTKSKSTSLPKPKKEEVKPENKPKTTKKAVVPKQTAPKPTPKSKSVKPELVDLDKRVDPVTEKVPVIERAGFSKTKRFKEDKYVRLASNATQDKFNEMGRKVNEGLVEWSFYAIDGDLGYHYYLVLDTKPKK